jgi:dimethylamine monooxygenase subunit A
MTAALDPEAGPRFVPYDKGRFQLTLGIKAIEVAEWIDVDHHYAAHLAEKRRLLAERPGEVFDALPEADEAQAECLEVLLAHLARYHPGLVTVSDEGVRTEFDQMVNKWRFFANTHLDLAGRLVQEDLCLMAPDSVGHRLIAASLCFPARWRLADKLGRPMTGIHAPVPGFNDKLARPVERFFTSIAPDQVYMRLNWSVMDDPTLFQSTGHGRGAIDPSITADRVAENLHIRIERQTFRRLPRTGVLVFGIKTVVDPITVLVDRPELASAMLRSLRSMPEDMRAYKSMAPFTGALDAWLEMISDI